MIYSSFAENYKNKSPLLIVYDLNGKIIDQVFEGEEKVEPPESREGFICFFNKKVIIVTKHWGYFFIYDSESKEIRRVNISYSLFERFVDWNKQEKNNQPNVKWFSNIIANARVVDGKIYILMNLPRLEILCVDFKGNIVNHFYNDIDFKRMRWYGFEVEPFKQGIRFYISGFATDEKDQEEDFNIYSFLIN